MSAEPAFLLHRRAYRETSALVDLLTLHHGRIRAVAQGGQRPTSKSRQRLQPFTPLLVTWRGERELKRLTLMESRGATALLAGEGLLCGLYANEIATRLLPLELPAGDAFAFYTALLEALPAPAARALALRRYEWSLLEALDATPRFCTPTVARSTPRPSTGSMRTVGRSSRPPKGWTVAPCAILITMIGRSRRLPTP